MDEYDNPAIWWDDTKKIIKKQTMEYCKHRKRKERNETEALKQKIGTELDTRNPDWARILTLKTQLQDTLENTIRKQNLYTQKKDLLEDEKPTKYFYDKLKKRQQQTTITQLKTQDGRIVNEKESILDKIKLFYTNLWGHGHFIQTALAKSFLEKM